MQNIRICLKRQCLFSQKTGGLLLKYNLKKYCACIVKHPNINFSTELTRLCSPLLQQLYIRSHKRLNNFLTVFFKNEPHKIHSFLKLCNTKNFSTTSNNHRQSNNESVKADDPEKDPKDPKEFELMIIKIMIIVSTFFSIVFIISTMGRDMDVNYIDWNTFVHDLLLKGFVQDIVIAENRVYVGLKHEAVINQIRFPRRSYLIINSDIRDVEAKIRTMEKHIGIKMEDGIPIYYRTSLEGWGAMFDVIILLVVLATMSIMTRAPLIKTKFSLFGDLRKAKYTLVDPFSGKGVRFKDVAGLSEAKIEVMEFVDYLKNPERYKKLGAKVPKGALLLGPPGCGKTLLAKAVATESNVPFLSMNGSEFSDIVGGVGAARVRSLFAEARKRAPSIIYIDEIDAIGKKRSEASIYQDSESERTLNQLLVEMDGMTTAENIIIMASTNRGNVLDKALLRPGRFDRHILIDLPTLEERIQIFEYHLSSLSLEGQAQQYAKYLAHLTPGFSGAEIANVCNESALHAATEQKTKVHNSDLMYAIDKIIGGTVKKSSTLAPSEKQVVVYHEAGHAVAAWLLEHVNPLIKITVVPRTNKRLGFAQYSDSNLKLQSSEHLFERMCVLLGGRVAETIMFNKVSTRAQNDLKKVTEIAYHQVQQFGMSPLVGLISFNKEVTNTKLKKPYSKKLGNLMDAEVRRIITEAYKTTEKLLHDNKDKVTTLAEALLKQETLSYKDIEALIGPPPFGKKDLQ